MKITYILFLFASLSFFYKAYVFEYNGKYRILDYKSLFFHYSILYIARLHKIHTYIYSKRYYKSCQYVKAKNRDQIRSSLSNNENYS